MSDEGVFTVRLDQDKKAQLEAIAAAEERSRNYIVGEAIDQYLALRHWQIEAIEQGRRAVEEGRFVAHEDVKQKWVRKRDDSVD